MPRTKIQDGVVKRELKIDVAIKQEFLEKQKNSTKKFYAYILGLADEFEEEIGKSIYDFNIEERDELLLVKFKNKTPWAFQSNLAPLKKYVDFCIQKNMVRHNENRFGSILTENYGDYVNLQAMENAYISKSEIREWQKDIYNDQDKLILELLSWGVRGRTEKDNTLEELSNLKIEDVDFKGKILILTNNDGKIRYLDVDDYTIELIKSSISKTIYVFNNGFSKKKNDEGIYPETRKGLPINATEYVFRTPGKNKHGKMSWQLFQSKIHHMQKWLDKPYLTISNLYFSSIIDFAKGEKNKKGELTKEDYIRINERFNFGENGKKYVHKIQELINMYI